jgi:hypothetical protein
LSSGTSKLDDQRTPALGLLHQTRAIWTWLTDARGAPNLSRHLRATISELGRVSTFLAGHSLVSVPMRMTCLWTQSRRNMLPQSPYSSDVPEVIAAQYQTRSLRKGAGLVMLAASIAHVSPT